MISKERILKADVISEKDYLNNTDVIKTINKAYWTSTGLSFGLAYAVVDRQVVPICKDIALGIRPVVRVKKKFPVYRGMKVKIGSNWYTIYKVEKKYYDCVCDKLVSTSIWDINPMSLYEKSNIIMRVNRYVAREVGLKVRIKDI